MVADALAIRDTRRPRRDIQANARTRGMSRGDRRLTHARRCIIIRAMNAQLKPVAALITTAAITGATG
jgi:hypothetical protein